MAKYMTSVEKIRELVEIKPPWKISKGIRFNVDGGLWDKTN